jgi:uncharacterized membrane protein YsdA (DUF1294 family)
MNFLDSNLFIYYLLAINVVAFLLYGIDKYKAVHHLWRIPESVLLLTVVIGGGLGAMTGMKYFRHKTQHLKFRVGVPLIVLCQVGLIMYLR